jgi:hypothetical protein
MPLLYVVSFEGFTLVATNTGLFDADIIYMIPRQQRIFLVP